MLSQNELGKFKGGRGRSRQVYYSAAAQEDNLGDVVIRRTVLEWITSATEEVHVYRGSMSDSYIAALDAPSSVNFHDSAKSFTSAWLQSCGRRQAALVYAPGPRTAKRTLYSAKSAANMLAMTELTRLSGGPVIAVGGALRGEPSPALQLHRLAAKSISHYSVRDPISQSLLGGKVSVIPDVAFAGAEPLAESPDEPVLAMSLRYDRPPNLPRLRGLIDRARTLGIQPIIVTQVRRDEENHQRLAEEFGIQVCGWTVQSHVEQLDRIQQIYRRAAVVVSDRLHACILGGRNGAAIVNAESAKSNKLRVTLPAVYSTDGSIAQHKYTAQHPLSDERNELETGRGRNCQNVRAAAEELRNERATCVDLLRSDRHGDLPEPGVDEEASRSFLHKEYR